MTSTSTTLQIRLSRKLRENAASALEEMGLDLPTAVRLFFTNVAKTRRIPFLLEADPKAEVLEVDSSTQASMDRMAKVSKKTTPRR
jgi:DNA-damage-inducible protein J